MGTDTLIQQLAETQKNALIFNKLVLDQSLRMALGKRGTGPANASGAAAASRSGNEQPGTPHLGSVARPTINGATLLSAPNGKKGSASKVTSKKKAVTAPAAKKKGAAGPAKKKGAQTGGGADAGPKVGPLDAQHASGETLSADTLSGAGGSDKAEEKKSGENVSEKRRQQNRLASARFRAKNRRSREAAQELEALKDQNARLKADNVALVTQLRMMNTSVTNEMRGIQEGTLNWVLSKFWLRRRLSFKTVATAITAMVALQRRVRAGAAGGSCPPLPKGRKAKTAAKTVAGGRRQLQPQEEPPKKKLRRQTSRRLA
jgi:hypothetical protein